MDGLFHLASIASIGGCLGDARLLYVQPLLLQICPAFGCGSRNASDGWNASCVYTADTMLSTSTVHVQYPLSVRSLTSKYDKLFCLDIRDLVRKIEWLFDNFSTIYKHCIT